MPQSSRGRNIRDDSTASNNDRGQTSVPQQDSEIQDTDWIATRAYQRYEERGRDEGYDVEDWLSAEQEFRTRLNVARKDRATTPVEGDSMAEQNNQNQSGQRQGEQQGNQSQGNRGGQQGQGGRQGQGNQNDRDRSQGKEERDGQSGQQDQGNQPSGGDRQNQGGQNR